MTEEGHDTLNKFGISISFWIQHSLFYRHTRKAISIRTEIELKRSGGNKSKEEASFVKRSVCVER